MPRNQSDLLPGTFELLILKSLSLGPMHGWGISERIERLSGGVFDVQQGAVYPALQRLLRRGWVTAAWRDADTSRRARFYRLTASGRGQLEAEMSWWRRASGGIDRVLRSAAQES